MSESYIESVRSSGGENPFKGFAGQAGFLIPAYYPEIKGAKKIKYRLEFTKVPTSFMLSALGCQNTSYSLIGLTFDGILTVTYNKYPYTVALTVIDQKYAQIGSMFAAGNYSSSIGSGKELDFSKDYFEMTVTLNKALPTSDSNTDYMLFNFYHNGEIGSETYTKVS